VGLGSDYQTVRAAVACLC